MSEVTKNARVRVSLPPLDTTDSPTPEIDEFLHSKVQGATGTVSDVVELFGLKLIGVTFDDESIVTALKEVGPDVVTDKDEFVFTPDELDVID